MRPDEMEAGRELDALIAEKVMGWRQHEGECWEARPSGPCINKLPKYSSDISAAFGVVEHLRQKGLDLDLTYRAKKSYSLFVTAFFTGVTEPTEADEPALAICRAALKAVMV